MKFKFYKHLDICSRTPPPTVWIVPFPHYRLISIRICFTIVYPFVDESSNEVEAVFGTSGNCSVPLTSSGLVVALHSCNLPTYATRANITRAMKVKIFLVTKDALI